jgi:hypothetical protein
MKLLSALQRLFESAEQRKARLRDEAKKARRAKEEAKKAKKKAERDMKLAATAKIREQEMSVKTERPGGAITEGTGSLEICRLCGVKMESNSLSLGVRLMQTGQVGRLMALATVCRLSGHIQCTGCAHRAGGRCPSCKGDLQPHAF